MRNNSKRVMIGIAVTIVIAILLPILFGDLANDPWTKWVYNYQALISAVFAIGAALITVNTMRETDDKQEKRHQELMSLNLRREHKIVRRAAHPQLEEMQDCLHDFIKYFYFMDVKFIRIENECFERENKRNFTNALSEFKKIVKREQINDVKFLLTPSGYRSLQLIFEYTDICKSDVLSFPMPKHPITGIYINIPNTEEFNSKSQIVANNIDILINQVITFMDAIGDLLDDYSKS